MGRNYFDWINTTNTPSSKNQAAWVHSTTAICHLRSFTFPHTFHICNVPTWYSFYSFSLIGSFKCYFFDVTFFFLLHFFLHWCFFLRRSIVTCKCVKLYASYNCLYLCMYACIVYNLNIFKFTYTSSFHFLI